jgi:glycosyltransferase involved in cell wall biosynthesis
MPPINAPPGLRVMQVVTAVTFAGIERHVVNLSRELAHLGCTVEVACPPAAYRLREEAAVAGIAVTPSAAVPQAAWLPGIARGIVSARPQVLHVHDGRAAVIGAPLARLTRAGFVRTQHFTLPASFHRGGWRGRGSLALHRLVNGRLDAYVAVSNSVEAGAVARREIHSEAVVIPPAITLPDQDVVVRAREARRRLPTPVVVFAGRFEAERRLDVLLRAIPLVLALVPDCRFVLAGSGTEDEGLRHLAAQLGVADAITWTGWLADPYDVLGRAHVYVNTWPGEAFGMSMAEAMALELPVVAVDAGANGEMVEDGVTGFLVPENDPVALARALARLATDRAGSATMGEAARLRAVSRFGASYTAESTLALYRRIRPQVTA